MISITKYDRISRFYARLVNASNAVSPVTDQQDSEKTLSGNRNPNHLPSYQRLKPLAAAFFAAALLTQTSPTIAQESPGTLGCDYADAHLYGGWGWNPVSQQSCEPLAADNPVSTAQTTTSTNNGTPICQFASDPDRDGWGWENNRSCRVSGQVATPAIASVTATDAVCVDSDGDGWGWDGTASCRVDGSENVPLAVITPVAPTQTSECIDTDGDGYGWNGTSSCDPNLTSSPEPVTPAPVAQTPITQPSVTQATAAQPSATQPSATQASVATGGCEAPASGSVFVSSTTPVQSNGNPFFPDRGPQCVLPASQFSGPGLAYGDFLLSNNAWNGDKSTYPWTQCIALTETNGRVNPSWTYDWGNEDDLLPGFQEWEVKSYPEIIFGYKSNSEISADCADTGLPVTYSDMPQIDIDYSYRTTQTNNRIGDLGSTIVTGGDRNIAMESFLHSSCDIRRGADSNRQFELMVWLDHGAERLPSGSPPVSTYTDSFGRNYDVYVKGAADPGYVAYVAQQEFTSGNLNWNEFFADAQANAGSYGINRIDNNWCLANILFGTEIWWGEGSFAIDRYDITRSY